MKILFYVSSMRGGGAERVCNTLANEFLKRGKEIHVSYNMDVPIMYTFENGVRQHNHAEGTKTTKFWSRFLVYRFLRTLYNMRKVAKKVRPDLVVSFMTDYAIFSITALMGLRIPIIVSEHTTIDRMRPRYRLLSRLLYRRAVAVTVLTRRDYKVWKKIYKNLLYMPNPMTVVSDDKNYERQKWVLGVGRVSSPEKGFDSMVKCWNLLYKKHPEWKLVIAGKYEENDIKNLYAYLDDGRDSNVFFLGFRSDIFDLMKQSEIFVLSSRYEGLPMGLMEAMAAGCCCVAFDVVTGPSDIIQHNKSGILVENQNINELAISLDSVMKDEKLRNYFSCNAPDSVKKFSSDKVLDRWEILFDKVISKNTNARKS